MSELVVTLSLEDCVAFSDYHYPHSAASRKARRKIQIGFALLSSASAAWSRRAVEHGDYDAFIRAVADHHERAARAA